MAIPLTRPSDTLSHGGGYVFSVVGTSRCDVRAACSGAIPSSSIVARIFIPPATTRAGTAQRAVPTIALNTYGLGRSAVRWWRCHAPFHASMLLGRSTEEDVTFGGT